MVQGPCGPPKVSSSAWGWARMLQVHWHMGSSPLCWSFPPCLEGRRRANQGPTRECDKAHELGETSMTKELLIEWWKNNVMNHPIFPSMNEVLMICQPKYIIVVVNIGRNLRKKGGPVFINNWTGILCFKDNKKNNCR